MVDQLPLRVLNAERVAPFISHRASETKLGERIRMLDEEARGDLQCSLKTYKEKGFAFALVGVPEDIGVRANFGRGGARGAWNAFLRSFLNLPIGWIPEAFVLVGEVELTDLITRGELLDPQRERDLTVLREMCAEVDSRVERVLRPILQSGLIPIVIGGGHNNALPLLRALASLPAGPDIGCFNIDAHSDIRPSEGRHSGNAFRYALDEKILDRYCILGLQETLLSEHLQRALLQSSCRAFSYEEILIRRTRSFEEAITEALRFVADGTRTIALEVDLDVIAHAPTSAMNPCGFSVEDIAHCVHRIALEGRPSYLHVSEGAPALADDGDRIVGRIITQIVCSYLDGCLNS